MNQHSLTLLSDIGLGIIFAAAASHLARLLRQPLILGYVLGGALLGNQLGFGLVTSEVSIELISEMGLILLLFIIGLEINLRELMHMGKAILIIGSVQFVGCLLLGLAYFKPLGFSMGGGSFDLLYLAVALALSSTTIVVKLLHDKFETRTAAGRLTIAILVLQDICAIIFMAVQPSLRNPQLGGILRSFGQGGVLVALAFLASRYILPRVFNAAGKYPELVLLSSTAWCFLICGLAERAELSKEMGALIAGVSMSAFPYGHDVSSKLGGVRDFFVTLFFVSLGLKVPHPSLSVVGLSFIILLFVIFSRILSVVPMAALLKMGLRIGFVSAINLSQVSEFSLIILSLGVSYQHVSADLQGLILLAMLVASVVSTYLIHFNDRLARWVLNLASGLRIRENQPSHDRDAHTDVRDIVLLGCFREGQALLEVISHERPDVKPRILVLDFNPAVLQRFEREGYKSVYADLAHHSNLQRLGLENASLIICSISDTFLKGTTNRRLLSQLLPLAPNARIVMTADEYSEAENLRQAGAYDVVVSSALAASHLFSLLKEAIAS